MRIAVLGGGPGGLLAAVLAKRGDPAREVTVFERNRAGETFGFGVREIVAELPVTKMGKLDKKALRDWLKGDLIRSSTT